MSSRALSPRFVQGELARLRLAEWTLIRECSRSGSCSVNRCPLDPLIGLRITDPSDRETRCPMSRPDRERACSRLSPEMRALLPFGGLYASEFARREAGRRRQASLSPEQREQQQALLARHRAAPFRSRTSTATKPGETETASDPSEGSAPQKAGADGGVAA